MLSTLLGPERTTPGLFLSETGLAPCGALGVCQARPGLAYRRRIVGFGVGLVGCGLVVC